MNGNPKQTIKLQVNKLKNLPALPELSVRILEAINNPDISIEKLADTLILSPSLVARLLGLANSAYFGQSRQINDLRTAIVQVLGVELVKSLTMGIVLNVHFDAVRCKHFDTEYFWMRSLLTAVAGQKLATRSALQNYSPSTVYTSGLLLSIGVLILAFLFPEDMDAIFERCRRQSLAVGEEISREFGMSHYQVGHHLLQKWHLATVYQSVIGQFDASTTIDDEMELVPLLKASQWISGLVLDNRAMDTDQLARLANAASMPVESMVEVIEEMMANKQDIKKLASIMGS